MDQLKHLIEVWTSYAQGLTGSIGALAFVCAFIWMIARLDELFIFVNRAINLNMLTRLEGFQRRCCDLISTTVGHRYQRNDPERSRASQYDRGFGFIAADEGAREFFFHRSVVDTGTFEDLARRRRGWTSSASPWPRNGPGRGDAPIDTPASSERTQIAS